LGSVKLPAYLRVPELQRLDILAEIISIPVNLNKMNRYLIDARIEDFHRQ